MLDFYKKAFFGAIGLLLLSTLIAYFCVQHTFLQLALLPSDTSKLPWQIVIETDGNQPGNSVASVNDARYSLDFELTVSTGAAYPSASVALLLQDDTGKNALVDLSSYTSLSFSIKCSSANVLTLLVFTLDEQISHPDDFLTYRSPSAFFSCDQDWSQVEVDLTHLAMQQWWLEMFHQKLSMNEYQLDKVAKIQFGTTSQSPFDITSRIQVGQLILHGTNWTYMYLLIVSLFVLWCGYAVWFFKQHAAALTSDLKDKILRERPLVAYRQLNMEPQRDKDQDAILRYMATAYANPELNLDIAVAEIGVSRTKINDVLKAELGFTFTGYLNKIRLTEAARLLSEKDEANIAEIAYSVGYKNVSYFNKLFKEEYGCTPKTFKSYLQ
jgi:AraC-like DNA-binding protein